MKKFLIITAFLTLATHAQATQLNTTSNLNDNAEGRDVGAVTTGFAMAINDLPLMPGLQLRLSDDVVFDTPKSGRIAETTAEGEVDVDQVYVWYKKTLPQMGWKPLSARSYQREHEVLNIDAHASGKITSVHFEVKPN